jgi:hypothetical protein
MSPQSAAHAVGQAANGASCTCLKHDDPDSLQFFIAYVGLDLMSHSPSVTMEAPMS